MPYSNLLKIAGVLRQHEKIAARILNGDVGLNQLVEHIKKARSKQKKTSRKII